MLAYLLRGEGDAFFSSSHFLAMCPMCRAPDNNRFLPSNDLTTLAAGMFDPLGLLEVMYVQSNSNRVTIL